VHLLLERGHRVRAFVHRHDDRSQALAAAGATPDRLSLDDMPPRVWVNRLLEEIADQALEGQVGRTPSADPVS